jgi:hypothetical protein
MQHFKISSLPVMVLTIFSFFLIAYNAHNGNYDYFFDSDPIQTVMLEIKPEDIVRQSTFEETESKIYSYISMDGFDKSLHYPDKSSHYSEVNYYRGANEFDDSSFDRFNLQ